MTNMYIIYMYIFYEDLHLLNVKEVLKFGGFESLLCSPTLHLFEQKYSKNSNIVNYYCNVNNWFLFE